MGRKTERDTIRIDNSAARGNPGVERGLSHRSPALLSWLANQKCLCAALLDAAHAAMEGFCLGIQQMSRVPWSPWGPRREQLQLCASC